MIGWLCCFLVPAGALLGSQLSQEDEEDEEGLPERERKREREAGRACTRRRREWVCRSNAQSAIIAVDDGKTKRKNNNKQGSTSSPTVERRSSREMPMKNRFGV